MTTHSTAAALQMHRSHLRLMIDDHNVELNVDTLRDPLPSARIVAVEVPGDLTPRPVMEARDLLGAMSIAIATVASRCGSIKGIRHLRRGATGKRIVYFPSMKNGAQMQCESRLEALHAMAAEQQAKLCCYRCQPFRIYFDGWSYTPDVLTLDDEGAFCVHEIKPNGKLEDPPLQLRLAIVHLALHRFGLPFQIRTEHHSALPSDAWQRIYRTMNKCRHIALLTEACIAAFQETEVWRMDHLRSHLQTLGYASGSVERLLWERVLVTKGSIARAERTLVRVA